MKDNRIAIVSVASILPDANTTEDSWMNILGKKDSITDVPPSHFLIDDYYDPDQKVFPSIYCKRGGFLKDYPFDPVEFNIPPNTLQAIDTAQLYGLIAAKKLLANTKSYQNQKVQNKDISVIIGAAAGTEMVEQMSAKVQRPVWVKVLREHGLPESEVQKIAEDIANEYPTWTENNFPGMLTNVIAGRIANRLDLGGANFVVDAACASSLAAISLAVQSLHSGESDMVITGGVDAINTVLMFMCFTRTPALSKSGNCRPFSDEADGTILGEGTVLFALRRFADAERDGDNILAVISGIGSSSDGRGKSIYAPIAKGQSLAIQRTYEKTSYGLGDVELVEAHGTGTIAGDKAEFEGLQMAMSKSGVTKKQFCALGTIKSQIGHTKSTAGAAGLMKCVLALKHKILPPTINIKKPSPELHIEDSAFYLNLNPRPWIKSGKGTRKASVSSFGFGGSNFHLTVEEYSGSQKKFFSKQKDDGISVLFSSSNKGELLKNVKAFLSAQMTEKGYLQFCRNSQLKFRSQDTFRMGVVATDFEEASSLLRNFLPKLEEKDLTEHTIPGSLYFCGRDFEGKKAFVFAGQGSQYLNMASDLVMQFEEARAPWDEMAELAFDDKRLQDIVFPVSVFGEAEKNKQAQEIHRIEVIQPALALTTLSQLNLLMSLGVTADVVAGHSFGELSALFAAGVIRSRADYVELAKIRSELMKQASLKTSVTGAMSAVLADEAKLANILKLNGIDLTLANINSSKQVVIAGALSEIEKAEKVLTKEGFTVKRLSVPSAFHTKFTDCSQDFRKALGRFTFHAPKMPVYSNLTAAIYPVDAEAIKDDLSKQLCSQVRFRDEILKMFDDGVRLFIEIGPQKILSGFINDTIKASGVKVISLDHGPKVKSTTSFVRALTEMSVIGLDVQYEKQWEQFYEFDSGPTNHGMSPAHLMINGANVGKPYPPRGGTAMLPKPNAEKKMIKESSETRAPEYSVLQSIEALQRMGLEAEKAFQQNLMSAHMAYLQSTQEAIAALLGKEISRLEVPRIEIPKVEIPQVEIPRIEIPRREMTAAPKAPAAVAVKSAPVPEVLPGKNKNTEAIILDVISVKTGYPKEMLDMDAELESGLGIDSIKRVEILSELQERLPELKAMDTTKLATLNTIREILNLSEGDNSIQESPGENLVLQIVSEKTGYPLEMLDIDADLESGLGIDSIKRVEILSEIQERIPAMKTVDTTKLATLNTIREILALNLGKDLGRPEVKKKELTPTSQTKIYNLEWIPSKLSGFILRNFNGQGTIFIVKDQSSLALKLKELFSKINISCEIVEEAPQSAGKIISLRGLSDLSLDEGLALNKKTFLALKNAVTSPDGFFVAVYDDSSNEEASYRGGLSGLLKTASIEMPHFGFKAINLSAHKGESDRTAEIIFKELIAGGNDVEVKYNKDFQRQVGLEKSFEFKRGQPMDFDLRESDVVIVSGGVRGVTADCLLDLGRSVKSHFVIFGRTVLIDEHPSLQRAQTDADLKVAVLELHKSENKTITPTGLTKIVNDILHSREIKKNLQRFLSLGQKVSYIPLDIQNKTAVTEKLEDVRKKIGPVKGIIHGAGVLADKLIVDKTPEQFDSVFNTKVIGLRNLLEATTGDDLRLIACFSSIAARKGNSGQSDYAMANEVLNKICVKQKELRKDRCVVKSFNWGPWDGGMVSSPLKKHFESLGVGLIPLSEGASFFTQELANRENPTVEVIVGAESSKFGKKKSEKESSARLWIHESQQSFLKDHMIKDAIVVPMVVACEYGLRFAVTAFPDVLSHEDKSLEVSELKVKKGIVVKNFSEAGLFLEFRARIEGSKILVECLDEGKVAYTFNVSVVEKKKLFSPLDTQNFNWTNWKIKKEEVYSKYLFHGPDFQVIRNLSGKNSTGGHGVLHNEKRFYENDRHWVLDVAMLDGGVQASVLWKIESSGKDTLPLGFEHLVVHHFPPAGADLVFRMEVREDKEFFLKSDVRFYDERNVCVYELIGLTTQAGAQDHIYRKS